MDLCSWLINIEQKQIFFFLVIENMNEMGGGSRMFYIVLWIILCEYFYEILIFDRQQEEGSIIAV